MKIKETIYREVKKYSGSAHIILPSSLIGEEVQISFERKLTEEERKKIQLSKLIEELRILRIKRKKKIK